MIADAEVVALLSSPKLEKSRLLTDSAMREFEAEEKLDHGAALSVVTRYSVPGFGEGIARLEEINPEVADDEKVGKALASSGLLPEIDRIARAIADKGELADFATALVDRASDQKALTELVNEALKKRLGVIQ
jgi:hypothetical protein